VEPKQERRDSRGVSGRGELKMYSDYCKECGKTTRMVMITEAKEIVSVSERTIYDWMSKRKLHI
jgi:hypothetical protein